MLFTVPCDLGLIALRSVSLLRAFVSKHATPDSVYLRAFRQLLFLDRARRATDKDHGDPRRGSSRTAKTVRGSGGPWAGGSHLSYTSIPGLTIALISLINPTLREQNPPQTSISFANEFKKLVLLGKPGKGCVARWKLPAAWTNPIGCTSGTPPH